MSQIKERFATGLFGFGLSAAGQCVNCAWYLTDQKCHAFLKGIPQAVFDDAIDHSDPVEGDNGLRFKAAGTPGESL